MAVSSATTRPTEAQILQFIQDNPGVTDEEIRAFATGGEPPPEPSLVGTALNKLGAIAGSGQQFFTVGLGDEIFGTLEGLLRPGVSIPEAIEAQRERLGIVREAAPVLSTAADIGFGVAGGLGAANAIISRSGALANILGRIGTSGGLGTRVATGAAASGLAAGAEAFGRAEGSPVERVPETAFGTGAGLALGAALPAAGATFRGLSNALNVRPQLVNPQQESRHLIMDAFRKDLTEPEAVLLEAGHTPDVPLSAADLAGEHTRQLVRTAQTHSSTARAQVRNTLELRTEAERARHVARLKEVLNPEDKDVIGTLTQLKDLRAKAAEANFAPALNKVVTDPQLAAFFREPEVKQAYMQMVENARTRAAAGIPTEIPPAIYDQDGKLVTIDIPVRVFHFAQQAVNDVINSGLEAKTITRERARTLLTVLHRMFDKVEKAVPEYAAARQVYRNDSNAINALRAGAGKKPTKRDAPFAKNIPLFNKASTKEIAEYLNGLRARARGTGEDAEAAAAELESYALGAFSFLRDKIQSKESINFLNIPTVKNRIRLIMGGNPRKAQQFIDALRAERRTRLTQKVSKEGTAIQEEQAVPSSAMDLLLVGIGATSNRPYATLASLGRLMRAEQRMSEETANAVVQNLFAGTQSFEELVQSMMLLRETMKEEAERGIRSLGGTAGAAAGFTSAGASLVQQQQQ